MRQVNQTDPNAAYSSSPNSPTHGNQPSTWQKTRSAAGTVTLPQTEDRKGLRRADAEKEIMNQVTISERQPLSRTESQAIFEISRWTWPR